jgi:hypothetical protein
MPSQDEYQNGCPHGPDTGGISKCPECLAAAEILRPEREALEARVRELTGKMDALRTPVPTAPPAGLAELLAEHAIEDSGERGVRCACGARLDDNADWAAHVAAALHAAGLRRVEADECMVTFTELNVLRLSHEECEDCWYSCPKCAGGCCDKDKPKDRCTCGADAHNAKVELLIERALAAQEKPA